MQRAAPRQVPQTVQPPLLLQALVVRIVAVADGWNAAAATFGRLADDAALC